MECSPIAFSGDVITEFGTGIFQPLTGATGATSRRKCRRWMPFSYWSRSHDRPPASARTFAACGQFVQFFFVSDHFHFRQICFNSSHHLGLQVISEERLLFTLGKITRGESGFMIIRTRECLLLQTSFLDWVQRRTFFFFLL